MNNADPWERSRPICRSSDMAWGNTESYAHILGYCFVILPLCTLCLNIVELVVVFKAPKLKTHTRLLLISLAICDILMGSVVMPFQILRLVRSDAAAILGETGCIIGNSLDLMLLATSVLHMSALTVDRCVASVRPFQQDYWFGRKYGSLIFATCWVLPAVLTFGFILPSFHAVGLSPNCVVCQRPALSCRMIVNTYYSIIYTTFALLIPAIIVFTCTRCIVKASERRQQVFMKLSRLNFHTRRGSFLRRYYGTTLSRTIITMTNYSFIFWLPFLAVFVIDPFVSHAVPHLIWVIVTWCRHLRPVFCPFVYMKGSKILKYRTFF